MLYKSTLQHKKTTKLKRVCWYAPWYEQNPKRLIQEQAAIRQRFPRFTLTRGNNQKLGWVGALTSNRGQQYKLLIEYPSDFPFSEPSVYILNPAIESQHMFNKGRLCLMYPGEGTWETKTTCSTLVAIAAAWIFAYENHSDRCRRDDGKPCLNPKCPDWPGPKQ